MVSNKKNLIVVVNGMVGFKFLEKFVGLGGNGEYNIRVFGDEPRPAYDRVHLTEYFSGKTAEDLTLGSRSWYEENGIELTIGTRITGLNRDAKKVTAGGEDFYYGKLVIATGSTPFVPPVPGIDNEGIFVYRTIEDLDSIISFNKGKKTAAVIGGGLLGLEAAKAAVDLGLKTHVVEFAPKLMARQLDEGGAGLLRSKIEALGVDIHLNKNTREIKKLDVGLCMLFADGSSLDVDSIIVSAGIKPQDDLARSSGLDVGERGGIKVNKFMQTSDSSIYAIGECALYEQMIYGLVAPGYRMAESAAKQILNEDEPFEGADMSTQLKLMGVQVGSFGDALANGNSKAITLENASNGIYKKLIIDESGTRLIGGILVGETSEYNQLHQMYLSEMPLPKSPESLLFKQEDDSAGVFSVAFLPSLAVVCNCENITKGDLVKSIREDGVTTIDGLKKCTKSGTGCGGCLPLMTDILKLELENMGVEVDKSLCSHFSFTRQELYSIVRREKIKTYDDLMLRHGSGDGCEICKPAVASILASCWNDPILDQKGIQDSNDAFLANIQKNGTYSIVPRIAGGELTPDQIIVIGQVTKDFNLYTKITGGQRIDMFGAKVEELPVIWGRLVEAGFESGHAYGKSLRTVKSCVGTSWCRFGVQDSTSLAIELENRYKGLRSPHKIKGGVSGCVRECAEAQGKDFGVIATDKGWNLYFGGNGGAKPQHAVLFAADIKKPDVIKYLDRLLMYYIRGADRLMRTATWLNNLEGGIEHLRNVVIEDSLNICEELEQEMAENIANYECEWANVLKDLVKLEQFKPFLNTEEPDSHIRFTNERAQIKPAQCKGCGCR